MAISLTPSTVTCTNTTIGDTATITINKSKYNYTHTLECTFKSFSVTIAEKIAVNTWSWVVPYDFYYEITNNNSGIATMHCYTYDGIGLIGATHYDFTVYANPYNTPTIAPIIKDSNSATIALTGNSNKLIRYRSTAQVETNATVYNGASIASLKVTNGTNYFTTPNGAFGNVESDYFRFEVYDSRGFKTIAGRLLSDEGRWIEYNLPTCHMEESKPDASGKITVKCAGSWWSNNFGAADNAISAQYRYKTEDGTYSSWASMTVSTDGNEYTAAATLSGLDYKSTYILQARATDKLSTTTSAEYKARALPVFSWSAEDFAFNVPVSFDGDTLDDFVIATGEEAMGSNGTWYWRKWRSGRAECYGCRNYGNMGVSTAWGSLYRSSTFAQELPSGLFSFTPEVIDISYRGSNNYGGWVIRHEETAPSTDTTGSFAIVRPASATLTQAYLSFNVIGRWK